MFRTGGLDSNIANIPNIPIHAISQLARIFKTDEVTRHIEFMGNLAGKIRRNPVWCPIGALACYQKEISHIYANPKPACWC
jgi:hypothetical protein